MSKITVDEARQTLMVAIAGKLISNGGPHAGIIARLQGAEPQHAQAPEEAPTSTSPKLEPVEFAQICNSMRALYEEEWSEDENPDDDNEEEEPAE